MTQPTLLGLDFGTDSVRAVAIDGQSGTELASAVSPYRRWSAGHYCAPQLNRFRQHPLDYLESMQQVITTLLASLPPDFGHSVAAIGVDTTGSTPIAVDRSGTALALLPPFAEDPDAMFILWKDHSALLEAEQITAAAKSAPQDYTCFVGGTYSSEWFWAKILHTLRTNPAVRDAAFSWVEHCDWIPAVLCDTTAPLALRCGTQGAVARLLGRTATRQLLERHRPAAGWIDKAAFFRQPHRRQTGRTA